jgi:hypothetical protein
MYFPPITGMSNIVPCPINVCQPLRDLNRLAVSHKVPRSRDNTYSVRFQKHGPKYLISNGRYCYSLPKWFHLAKFQKQISKSVAFLPQYVNIIEAVGQQLVLITVVCLFAPRTISNIGSLINRHIVYPIVLMFRINAHIIEILYRIIKCG